MVPEIEVKRAKRDLLIYHTYLPYLLTNRVIESAYKLIKKCIISGTYRNWKLQKDTSWKVSE